MRKQRGRVFREAVLRGAVCGLVLFAHLMLVAVLIGLRGTPAPKADADSIGAASSMTVRLVETPRLTRSLPDVPPLSVPRPARPSAHAPQAAKPVPPPAVTPTTEAPAMITGTDIVASPPTKGDSEGDPSLRRGLDAAGRHAGPSLPGSAIPRVDGLRMAAPSSISDTVRKVGNYMECSKVRMRRDLPGGTLDYRVMQAYETLGCKK